MNTPYSFLIAFYSLKKTRLSSSCQRKSKVKNGAIFVWNQHKLSFMNYKDQANRFLLQFMLILHFLIRQIVITMNKYLLFFFFFFIYTHYYYIIIIIIIIMNSTMFDVTARHASNSYDFLLWWWLLFLKVGEWEWERAKVFFLPFL